MRCCISLPMRATCPARMRPSAIQMRQSSKALSQPASHGRRISQLTEELQSEAGTNPKQAMTVVAVVDDLVENSTTPIIDLLKKMEHKQELYAKQIDDKMEKMEHKQELYAKKIEDKLELIRSEIAQAKKQGIIIFGVLVVAIFLKPPSWDIISLLGALANMFK